jgi:hypothetical protein
MTAILFEVYPKRALHEPIADLVLLDRDTSLKKARASARQWGGCVVKVKAVIISRNPFQRQVLTSEVVWVHKPRKPASEARDQITRKQLIGKLRQNNKSLYRGFRR